MWKTKLDSQKETASRKKQWLSAIPHMNLDQLLSAMKHFGIELDKKRMGSKQELKKITALLKKKTAKSEVFKIMYERAVRLHTQSKKRLHMVFRGIEVATLEELIHYLKTQFGITFSKKGMFKASDEALIATLQKERSISGEIFRSIEKRLKKLTATTRIIAPRRKKAPSKLKKKSLK